MTTCPRCGRENAADARFCSNCGASLVTRVSVQERRVVTAMFADLARSTGMGEALDPEVVRGIVGRFFELCSREVAARGGAIEKFSGDAVMAVFGIPTAHEDDPERAVRAALAIRDGVGDGVLVRVGVESGEVVVGDPFGGATMATGDAMNIAARLEQQAQPGEVVIGANVHEAVRDLVTAEPLGELALRGREGAVPGWRVSAVSADVGRPRGVPGLEAPLTGRDEELAALLNAAEHARGERKAVLFTIFGVPGVGKSRLTREATARLADDGWRVVRGRCLPYGSGITYWPVAEIIRALAGIDADTAPDQAADRLRTVTPDATVADVLALTLGIVDTSTDQAGAQDISYAFRRLVESVAAQTPLVLIFEDIHWAEPVLLDLIEYLATWVRDAPVLIVCPSRPELVDTRPAWGSGRMEASRISLEPLTEEEARSLLGALLTVEDLPPELRQRVLDRAEGNPLYVEEVVRMLIEGGVVEYREGHWYATKAAADVRVPDSVEALIRARLDTLPAPERIVLQAASVVGRVFQRSAVASIAPSGDAPPSLERHLEDAILRDIITEERAPDEPTYRFRHILIRDVAYGTLPKARRAELHTLVARWLRDWAGPRIDEFVEIEAYHLEQAVLLSREVGGSVDGAAVEAAADALRGSARKASMRQDYRAQRTLAERGLALEPPASEAQAELTWYLAEALFRLGEYTRSGEVAADLELVASAVGRRDLVGRAVFVQAGTIWISPESADAPKALAELRRARAILTEAEDWAYLPIVLENLGYEGWWYGDMEKAAVAWTEMASVASAHGRPDLEAQALLLVARTHRERGDAERASATLSRALELAERGGSRGSAARVKRQLGAWRATDESAEEGLRLLLEALAVLDELGDVEELASANWFVADLLVREGKAHQAVDYYERALELLKDHVGYKPEVERRVASMYLEMGDLETAARLAEDAVEVVAKDDWATIASAGSVLGTVRAAQGRKAEAERLLREATAVMATTEFNPIDEWLNLGEFLCREGRGAEGREWLAKASERVDRIYGRGGPMWTYLHRRIAAAEAEAGEVAAADAEAGEVAAADAEAGEVAAADAESGSAGSARPTSH